MHIKIGHFYFKVTFGCSLWECEMNICDAVKTLFIGDNE